MTNPPARPRRLLLRASGRQLLASLVALSVVPALLDGTPWAAPARAVLFVGVMLAILLAVGSRRGHWWLFGTAILLPVLLSFWRSAAGHLSAADPVYHAYLGYLVLLVAWAVWQIVRFVLEARAVDGEVVCLGISAYLLLGLVWSFLYLLIDAYHPNAYSVRGALEEPDAFYFSLCTLTTAGYGDVTPVARPARAVATMEAATGVMYVGVFIARLMSLYSIKPGDER